MRAAPMIAPDAAPSPPTAVAVNTARLMGTTNGLSR